MLYANTFIWIVDLFSVEWNVHYILVGIVSVYGAPRQNNGYKINERKEKNKRKKETKWKRSKNIRKKGSQKGIKAPSMFEVVNN